MSTDKQKSTHIKKQSIDILNRILEHELAGITRYTHYSLMIYGYNRIPIIDWLRQNAQESLQHAQKAGELLTTLGGHPSLKIGPLLETYQHDIDAILQESLAHEKEAIEHYYNLLRVVEGELIHLEEYARAMITTEEADLAAIDKMLRKPGQLEPYMQ